MVKKHDLTLSELKEMLESKSKSNVFGSRQFFKEKDLKELGIEVVIVDDVNNASEDSSKVALVFIQCKDKLAANYGYFEEWTGDYYFSHDFKEIDDEKLHLMGKRYSERKKQVETMEQVYDSLKVRGIFKKMEARGF